MTACTTAAANREREKKWRGNNAIIFKHPRHAISLSEEEEERKQSQMKKKKEKRGKKRKNPI